MKKLASVVMMIAITTFMAMAMTSASGQHLNYWRGIHGDYAMVATGNCLHSSLGFENLVPSPGSPVWTPIPGPNSVVWGASTMAEGKWTFERNWRGSVSGTNYVIDLPPFSSPRARENPILLDFTYELTRDGEITVTFDNPPPVPPGPPVLPQLHGRISMDHKTMTLWNANQDQPFAVGRVICNIGRVLIRVSNQDDD